MADEQEQRVADLLKKLKEAGAEIKDAKTNSPITDSVMSGPKPEFGAWVTWTKSF